MQIVIRTLNDKLYTYNTVATTVPAIRAELESAVSFLVRDIENRYTALIPARSVAEFIQRTRIEYLQDNGG